MAMQKVTCAVHGSQDLAIACIHICRAVDTGEKVGFFWSTEVDSPRPDAWCAACERWSCDHPDSSNKEWMQVAQFKILCGLCWDEAKRVQCG